MTRELKRYETLKELELEVLDIIHSVPSEQFQPIIDKLLDREQVQEFISHYKEFPANIQADPTAVFTLYAMTDLFEETILSIAEIRNDREKTETLAIASECFYFIQLLKKYNDNLTKLTPIEEARFALLQERFTEKPFLEKHFNVKYEYYKEHVPACMVEQFEEMVTDKVIGALSADPNADLRPYEKELQIIITKIECPGRTVEHKSDTSWVPKNNGLEETGKKSVSGQRIGFIGTKLDD